ncbi:hypothetical protein GWE18_00520 [Bradyrhizobium sp. CSA112]|nr:hypothetical protein [Bradyrhizobium sp. CSA112]
MTTEQIAMARHALGLPNESGQSYRNRYFTSCGSAVEREWDELVKDGMAAREKGGGKLAHFYLTEAGARAALARGETLDPEDFPPVTNGHQQSEAK